MATKNQFDNATIMGLKYTKVQFFKCCPSFPQSLNILTKFSFIIKQILSIPTSCNRQETVFSIVLLIQLSYILFYPFSILLQSLNSPFLFYLKNFYPKRPNYCPHDATKFGHSLFPSFLFYLNTVHIDTRKSALFSPAKVQ